MEESEELHVLAALLLHIYNKRLDGVLNLCKTWQPITDFASC
jgi:hypothetical protein